MRWLSLAEVLELHRRLIEQSGGMPGLRDLGLLEASLAQPHQSFGGVDLYTELSDKAAALGFSLIQNHPFVDGNKRIGHAAMETTLVLNGYELGASTRASRARRAERLRAGDCWRRLREEAGGAIGRTAENPTPNGQPQRLGAWPDP